VGGTVKLAGRYPSDSFKRLGNFMRTIFGLLAAVGVALSLAACGHNTEQSAAVGGAAGAVVSKSVDKPP
jgi:osmotically inducible lipoprotein OsmB